MATTKISQEKAFNVGIAMLVIGVVVGFAIHALLPTLAAHRSSGSSGSCIVSPNPQSIASTYAITINATGLPSSQIVNFYVQNTAGTAWGSVMTSSTGSATATTQNTVAGTGKVTFTSSGRKASTLASCTFSAI